MYIHIYMCIYICTYMYTYIYIYIHTFLNVTVKEVIVQTENSTNHFLLQRNNLLQYNVVYRNVKWENIDDKYWKFSIFILRLNVLFFHVWIQAIIGVLRFEKRFRFFYRFSQRNSYIVRKNEALLTSRFLHSASKAIYFRRTKRSYSAQERAALQRGVYSIQGHKTVNC